MRNMVEQIRCDECGGTMIGQKGEHRYRECGLNNVMLTDIMVYRCTNCSAGMPEIPATGILHRLIARRLILQKSRLSGEEIRFLRKFCGYSVLEFAEILGSSKSNISRMEKSGCGDANDRTIRLLVMSKLTRELVGRTEPILKNITVEQLINDVENSLKEVLDRAKAAEQFEFSSTEIARFSESLPEAEVAGAAVN